MAKRNLLHPDLRREIVSLALDGVQPAMIHRQIGGKATMPSIYMALTRARKEGQPIGRFPPKRLPSTREGGVTARVAVWQQAEFEALKKGADARGLKPAELVRRIVAAVLAGDLVDAVLDDLDASGGGADANG